MARLLRNFLAQQTGATAIEYGLIAAGIALVIVTAVNLISGNLSNVFNSVANGFGPGCVPTKLGNSC